MPEVIDPYPAGVRRSRRVGPSPPGSVDPVGNDRSPARRYYELAADAPQEVRVAAFRAALEILRPVLSRVWVSTTPVSAGSWPAEAGTDPDELAHLLAAQQPPVARRPGTGPDTLDLDPADDDSFALAHRMGPFSAAASAMSMDGKLVCDVAARQWRWRLTPAEHADLIRRLAELVPGTWLARVPKPGRVDPFPLWLYVFIAVVLGPRGISRGISGLDDVQLDLHTADAVLSLVLGAVGVVVGANGLVHAGRRFLAVRRRSSAAGEGA